MNDLPLFAHVPARRSDPETSKEAARSVNTTMLEACVYGALKAHGPMTSFEVADILRLSLVTVSPRFAPLRDKGLIKDTGRRKTGESGRGRTIWAITGE